MIDSARLAEHSVGPIVLGADVPVAQDGGDWIIGPVDASDISCRARNLVTENGQLYADLTLSFKKIVVKQILHFSVGQIGACRLLSEAIGDVNNLMLMSAFGNYYWLAVQLEQANFDVLAAKIINRIYKCSEGERSLSGLIKTPSDPAPPAPAWLVHPLIADDGISILFGQPGAGKSLLALCAALTAITGISFAGLSPPSKPVHKVMYLDWEGSERSFRFRLDALARTAQVDATELDISYVDVAELGRLNDIKTDIARALSERTIDLAIIDSASAAGGDTLSPSDAAATMRAIKSWGVPTLLIAHCPKDTGKDGSKASVYGAQAWTAAARLAILTEVVERNELSLEIVIRNGKTGSDLGYIQPRLISFSFANNQLENVESSEYTNRGEAKLLKTRLSVERQLIKVFKECGRQMKTKELEESSGLARTEISKALNAGAHADPPVFVEVGRVGNAKSWALATL